MGITPTLTREAALRAVIGGHPPAPLARQIRDVVCPCPRLAMAAALLIGAPGLEAIASALGMEATALERAFTLFPSPDLCRTLAEYQLKMEQAGVRFMSPPFHDRFGLVLRWGWASDRDVLSAASLLLGWPPSEMLSRAGVKAGAWSKASRKDKIPPVIRDDCLNALRTGGAVLQRGEGGGWIGVQLSPLGMERLK